jgi:predicted nucleic acid-binding protein
MLIERQFLFLPEPEATYAQWRRIVMESGVSGVQVHDARLAAVMNVNNVSHVLTMNRADFERFTGVTPVHPNELRSPST